MRMGKTMTYFLPEQDIGTSSLCFLTGRWEDAQKCSLQRRQSHVSFMTYMKTAL